MIIPKIEDEMIETNTYIMAFNPHKITEKIKVGYSTESVEQYVQILWDVVNAKNTSIAKTTGDDEKCAGNVVNKNLITTLMNVNFQINMPTVAVIILSTQDLVIAGN